MKVYHSSSLRVERPDIAYSRQYLDFGPGFYVTTIREQAEKYADRFLRRGKTAWLNVYEFDYQPIEWRTRFFESYNGEWLDFVTKCRRGVVDNDYDLVVGGIANDKVFQTLDLYFAGYITESEALDRLVYEKPNVQLCIRSADMLEKCLKFMEACKL